MAWWQASALFNGVICFCYLGITWNILKGLRDTHQMWSNRLALATAGIFFTCAVHHGSHTLHMLLPAVGLSVDEGVAMRRAFASHMTLWDLVGAGVACYYLSLRRSYSRLLTSPQLFEDRVREQTERGLRRQAFTDALTGLPNRAAFTDRMSALTASEGAAPALIFLDLDRFKLVNDTLGHFIGDQLLVAVAARLQASLGEGEELYRLGGDEFTVVSTSAGADSSQPLAQRLLVALTAPFQIEGHELYSGASVGAAQASHPSEIHDLLRRADTAMYHAKDAGGGTIRLFDADMSDKGTRLSLSNDLTRALARAEFQVEFQAIVDLRTGRIQGAEALVRWSHPERGRVSPDDFIPFAEETGQIVSIGRWVLQESCRQAARWPTDQGQPYVTVNVSVIEIERDDFIAGVRTALAAAALPPEQLWLEVTERSAGKDLAKVQARLIELSALGVRIALDDFGTGWSSLTHLHRLPVTMIKIDRGLVAGPVGSTADTLVSTVVLLGQTLDMQTVAEGIETDAQLRHLRNVGCDLGQGYLLGRPTDPETFLSTLRAGRAIPLPRPATGDVGASRNGVVV